MDTIQDTSCNIVLDRGVDEILWTQTIGIEFKEDNPAFENDVFAIKPYSWDDEHPKENEWHFWHKPSGLKLSWYKYPLRSACCNMNVSSRDLLAVFRDCCNSLHPYCTHSIKKWWEEERK